MNIWNKLISLALIPAMGLLSTAALADVSGDPDYSVNATNLLVGKDAQIKSANQCEGATFFKNAFPSLTNGTPGRASPSYTASFSARPAERISSISLSMAKPSAWRSSGTTIIHSISR